MILRWLAWLAWLASGPFAPRLTLCEPLVCSGFYGAAQGKGEGVNSGFVLPTLNHFVWYIYLSIFFFGFRGETAESTIKDQKCDRVT